MVSRCGLRHGVVRGVVPGVCPVCGGCPASPESPAQRPSAGPDGQPGWHVAWLSACLQECVGGGQPGWNVAWPSVCLQGCVCGGGSLDGMLPGRAHACKDVCAMAKLIPLELPHSLISPLSLKIGERLLPTHPGSPLSSDHLITIPVPSLRSGFIECTEVVYRQCLLAKA